MFFVAFEWKKSIIKIVANSFPLDQLIDQLCFYMLLGTLMYNK